MSEAGSQVTAPPRSDSSRSRSVNSMEPTCDVCVCIILFIYIYIYIYILWEGCVMFVCGFRCRLLSQTFDRISPEFHRNFRWSPPWRTCRRAPAPLACSAPPAGTSCRRRRGCGSLIYIYIYIYIYTCTYIYIYIYV